MDGLVFLGLAILVALIMVLAALIKEIVLNIIRARKHQREQERIWNKNRD